MGNKTAMTTIFGITTSWEGITCSSDKPHSSRLRFLKVLNNERILCQITTYMKIPPSCQYRSFENFSHFPSNGCQSNQTKVFFLLLGSKVSPSCPILLNSGYKQQRWKPERLTLQLYLLVLLLLLQINVKTPEWAHSSVPTIRQFIADNFSKFNYQFCIFGSRFFVLQYLRF